MWPTIQRGENNIGTRFEHSFWNFWGPTEVKYLDDKYNTSKKIQSIYCIYDSYKNIRIDDLSSIAFALIYECDDFGEHTIFFSYDIIPKITFKKSWEYCVFSDFDSEIPNDILLHELGAMDINLDTLSLKEKRNLYVECFKKGIITNINDLDRTLREFQSKKTQNDLNSIFQDCREELTKKQDPVSPEVDKILQELMRRNGKGPNIDEFQL